VSFTKGEGIIHSMNYISIKRTPSSPALAGTDASLTAKYLTWINYNKKENMKRQQRKDY
jgi:hypothetical protein